MNRSEILKPLSREHHTALVHVKRILERATEGAEAVVDYWQQVGDQFQAELAAHFYEEEVLVEGIDEPLLQRFRDEHRQLRSLMASPDAKNLATFANLLKAHVRFEERELFPCLEVSHYDRLEHNHTH
ncbi:hemerythrin domain-containing protein [Amphritea sp. 2_MG-2023]|uniref:hemerythrin domain-containing protein n=1 Tax=Amphritea TaxID=515417 RepID=UPI001C073B67|nr:hemerythrin domain-containing protein [Amphritea sp. 2_MG-2023]MBU2966890.1 hemerythrin domain-containing protein [Amphritea atlantica]MDO6420106.1 hemerythrin domain-containing protein [Amphritea sp. 2_MG-2023]